jgi:hypothetical protein
MTCFDSWLEPTNLQLYQNKICKYSKSITSQSRSQNLNVSFYNFSLFGEFENHSKRGTSEYSRALAAILWSGHTNILHVSPPATGMVGYAALVLWHPWNLSQSYCLMRSPDVLCCSELQMSQLYCWWDDADSVAFSKTVADSPTSVNYSLYISMKHTCKSTSSSQLFYF